MKEEIKLFEQELKDGDKTVGKIAIMRGGLHSNNPFDTVSKATLKYTNGVPHNQFVDIKLNDPWTRVIISDMSKLKFINYDDYLVQRERSKKINKIIRNVKQQNNN